MQKYCIKCGKEMSQDGKFCMSCGTEIKNDNDEQKNKNDNQKTLKIVKNIFGALLFFCVVVLIIVSFQGNNLSTIKDKEKEKIIDTEKPVPENKLYDLTSIIEQWRTKIAYLECEFFYSDSSTFSPSQYGSGTLIRSNNGEITILTNKHIVQQNKNTLYACTIQLPGESSFIVEANHRDDKFLISDNLDFAKIVQKISIVKNTSYTGAKLAEKYIRRPDYDFNKCETKASIGDSIVVLGYPSIGSKSDITATEGIISGYDGDDYYIVSAKVEEGNSGGAAILLKDNCYLGIPTFAMVGDTESMARILSINSLSE